MAYCRRCWSQSRHRNCFKNTTLVVFFDDLQALFLTGVSAAGAGDGAASTGIAIFGAGVLLIIGLAGAAGAAGAEVLVRVGASVAGACVAAERLVVGLTTDVSMV